MSTIPFAEQITAEARAHANVNGPQALATPAQGQASGSQAAPVFEFGQDFEAKIAALTLRDDRFAREATGFLHPDHFTDNVNRNLIAKSQELAKRYNVAPDPQMLITELKSDKRVQPNELPYYARRVAQLWQVDLKQRSYIRDKVCDWCRDQALMKLAADMPEMLRKGDTDQLHKRYTKAMHIGVVGQATFKNFFTRTEERETTREAVSKGTLIQGVPTGFDFFDDNLYHRGFGRGELTVFMAPAKRGKTAMMMCTALQSVLMHRKVWLYVSLEVSSDIMEDRIDANVSATAMDRIVDERASIRAEVEKYASLGLQFYIEEYPSNSVTTGQIENLIDAYINAGIKLDGVVVDYIGILRLTTPDDRFLGLGNAAKELRRIAGKYDISMVTAAQTNRDAVGKQVAKMDSIGESFAVVQDCDLLFSINADDAEMKSGVRRLYTAASRNSPEFTTTIAGDLSKMRMVERVVRVDF